MAIGDYRQSGGCDVWVLSAGHVRMDAVRCLGSCPGHCGKGVIRPMSAIALG